MNQERPSYVSMSGNTIEMAKPSPRFQNVRMIEFRPIEVKGFYLISSTVNPLNPVGIWASPGDHPEWCAYRSEFPICIVLPGAEPELPAADPFTSLPSAPASSGRFPFQVDVEGYADLMFYLEPSVRSDIDAALGIFRKYRGEIDAVVKCLPAIREICWYVIARFGEPLGLAPGDAALYCETLFELLQGSMFRDIDNIVDIYREHKDLILKIHKLLGDRPIPGNAPLIQARSTE